jgi:hypothetical protein
MTDDRHRAIISWLIYQKPAGSLLNDGRAELDELLALDAADEDRYEHLASEFPEEDGDATRH